MSGALVLLKLLAVVIVLCGGEQAASFPIQPNAPKAAFTPQNAATAATPGLWDRSISQALQEEFNRRLVAYVRIHLRTADPKSVTSLSPAAGSARGAAGSSATSSSETVRNATVLDAINPIFDSLGLPSGQSLQSNEGLLARAARARRFAAADTKGIRRRP